MTGGYGLSVERARRAHDRRRRRRENGFYRREYQRLHHLNCSENKRTLGVISSFLLLLINSNCAFRVCGFVRGYAGGCTD